MSQLSPSGPHRVPAAARPENTRLWFYTLQDAERQDGHEQTQKHGPAECLKVSWLRSGLQVNFCLLHTTNRAKQQQRRRRRPRPLSVVQLRRLYRLLLLLLLCSNQPLAGEVLENDVIITEGSRK